jgi:hypothetical protein
VFVKRSGGIVHEAVKLFLGDAMECGVIGLNRTPVDPDRCDVSGKFVVSVSG